MEGTGASQWSAERLVAPVALQSETLNTATGTKRVPSERSTVQPARLPRRKSQGLGALLLRGARLRCVDGWRPGVRCRSHVFDYRRLYLEVRCKVP